jgi:hypothetical protein
MIGALAADEHDGNGSQQELEELEELRVELVGRGTTGPVRNSDE